MDETKTTSIQIEKNEMEKIVEATIANYHSYYRYKKVAAKVNWRKNDIFIETTKVGQRINVLEVFGPKKVPKEDVRIALGINIVDAILDIEEIRLDEVKGIN